MTNEQRAAIERAAKIHDSIMRFVSDAEACGEDMTVGQLKTLTVDFISRMIPIYGVSAERDEIERDGPLLRSILEATRG